MSEKIKLTKAQRALLQTIMDWNDRNKSGANKAYIKGREPQYVALEKLGLIKSEKPFAFMFHSVWITDAGREVLA